jgi:signal transduction histidine kinase
MLIRHDSRFIQWLLEKKQRIILFGIFVIVGPLIALSTFVFIEVTAVFNGIVKNENETLLYLTDYHLEEQINGDIKAAKEYADRPLLIQALKNDNHAALVPHLRNFIENSMNIARIMATTPQGTGVAAYPDDQKVRGKNFSARDWYKGVSSTWTPYVSEFFLRNVDSGQYLFAMAVPVRDRAGGVVGILALYPKADYFDGVIGGMRIGSGFVYVVDKRGNLVYHPGFKIDRIYDFTGNQAVRKVISGLSGTEKSVDPVTRKEVISAFQPMKWGWGLVMQRPEMEVLKPVKTILIGLFIFTGIAVFLGIVVSYDGMALLYSIREMSVKLLKSEQVEKETNEMLQAELAERKLAEEKLARSLVDLERSNKELEQFAYVASHDLQEPLRKVGSFTELLSRRYKDQLGPDADRYIDYITDGAKRMSLLINDLLTFSRIGTSTRPFAVIDCNEVVKRTLDDLQYRVRESNAEVLCDDLPVIMADEMQISLVFQNLIGNALKFHRDESPRIHVSASRDHDGWIFEVSDNGIGIEKEYFDRIFIMFQRLHSRETYKGTGIGLAICKKVVERHGGRIWLESDPGRGSVFYFKIPDNKGE